MWRGLLKFSHFTIIMNWFTPFKISVMNDITHNYFSEFFSEIFLFLLTRILIPVTDLFLFNRNHIFCFNCLFVLYLWQYLVSYDYLINVANPFKKPKLLKISIMHHFFARNNRYIILIQQKKLWDLQSLSKDLMHNTGHSHI